MDAALTDLGEYLTEALGDSAITGWNVTHGELTLGVTREQVPVILKFLKKFNNFK